MTVAVSEVSYAPLDDTTGLMMPLAVATIVNTDGTSALAYMYNNVTGTAATVNTVTVDGQGNLNLFVNPSGKGGDGRYVVRLPGQTDKTVQVPISVTGGSFSGPTYHTIIKSQSYPVWDITHPHYGADPTNGTDATAIINQAMADAAAGTGPLNVGGIVWAPNGTYKIAGTLTGMLGTGAAPRLGVKFRGASQFGTIMKKATAAGNVIEISGFGHEVSNMTIDGNAKQAISGIIVRGYSAATTTYLPVRNLALDYLYVTGCKEGVRFGHYSTLNGVTGDSGDADIAMNGPFTHLWIDSCDYGWIEDGQNTLLNSVKDILFINITYNHGLCPRGGQPNFENGYFGPALTNTAKIDVGFSNGHFKDCRSENGATFNPPAFQSAVGNATSQTIMDGCYWTNGNTRTVADGVTTAGSGVVTSAIANWVNAAAPAGDVGASIVGPGIPVGATIFSVASSTSMSLNTPALLSGTGVALTIGRTFDVKAQGGSLTMLGCTTSGGVLVHNTTFSSHESDIQGGYSFTSPFLPCRISDKVHGVTGAPGPQRITAAGLPAAPATVADVAAILRSLGMCS